jgi:hypothetical protein
MATIKSTFAHFLTFSVDPEICVNHVTFTMNYVTDSLLITLNCVSSKKWENGK